MNNWQAWQLHLNRLRVTGHEPSWVVRIALICALAVIVIPLALLVLAALAVGVVVFATLAVLAWVVTMVRALVGSASSMTMDPPMHDDGRRNVRVIRR